VVDRVRKGGPREVLAAFEGDGTDPLDRLRREGEPAASQLRETLDRLQPGLGNPVMKVEVRDVPADPVAAADPLATSASAPAGAGAADPTELLEALARIAARLDALERRLG
jgi:hypothetical protein